MIGDIILPNMSRQLSTVEITEAESLCNEIKSLVENRDQYINDHTVDPLFAYPANNWDVLPNGKLKSRAESPDEFLNTNEFNYVYNKLANNLNPQLLNTLRLYVQVFSGYSLLSMDRTSVKLVEHHQSQGTIDLAVKEVLEHPTKRQLLDKWHSMISAIPERCIFSPPLMLGESGYEDSCGRIVSIDTIMYQERINILYESGIIDWLDRKMENCGEIRVLEIGGGWGALASWFKKTYPRMKYTILDLPECLIYSSLYLTLTQSDVPFTLNELSPKNGFGFIPNYAAFELEGEFDLIINTLSMSEMSTYQVERYCELISKKWLTDNGIFFEQNYDGRGSGLIFPYPIIEKHFDYNLQAKSTTVPLLQNGLPTIWSKKPLDLIPQNPRSLIFGSIRQLGKLGQYHLFEIGKLKLAIHNAVGNLNPYLLQSRDLAPAIFVAEDTETLISKCNKWVQSN
jgi:hypothetical protein